MTQLINKIKSLSIEYFDEIVAIRRVLHQNPELAFNEYKTSEIIVSHLDKWGIQYQNNIAKTGIIAIIEGNKLGKTIALRADMDALPINEQNNCDYKSKNHGIMHACGHDVHIASLLGSIKILNTLKDQLEGNIKFIFQPSEEKYPGGAKLMIEEGALANPKPSCILAQHVLPTLEVGKVGFRSGKYMASTDEVFLTVIGRGGHAATPELNIDPILIASHIIVALQQIVSRNASPNIPTVLSFGKINSEGGHTNIIPDKVSIAGTFRTYNEEWRSKAHATIEKMAKTIAESMGGNCEVFIDKGYPYLVNDEVVTEKARQSAVEYLGKDNVVELDMRMTAEDFAYYSQLIPACMYRLGIRNEAKEITSNLHTSTFDVDEKSLELGMGLMAWIALEEIK